MDLFTSTNKRSFQAVTGCPACDVFVSDLTHIQGFGDPTGAYAWLVEDALRGAAAEAHPAWRWDVREYARDEMLPGPRTEGELVNWYRRAHPDETAAIEDWISDALGVRRPRRLRVVSTPLGVKVVGKPMQPS
jgi:hypothetical protein